MDAETLERINELARKAAGPAGLTREEREEQAALRQAYLAEFRGALTAQLDNTWIQYPDGTRRKLHRREQN